MVKDDKLRTEMVKVLSQYKDIYLRKKNDVIRSIVRAIFSRDKQTKANLYATIMQNRILSDRDMKPDHRLYLQAYEEELLSSLLALYLKNTTRKQGAVDAEMRKLYDRLVVVSQINTSEKFTERVGLGAEQNAGYNVEVLTRDALRKM